MSARTSPREIDTGTPRRSTYDGTLRKATRSTEPPAQVTRATTRPDGTSITTSVTPSGSAATRPLSTAHVPRAIVPCPHAVEYPSLCQNNTPKCAPSSLPGTMNPPYLSACPRGSFTRSCRAASTEADDCAYARRSGTEAPGTSGPPEVTIRNGSPVGQQRLTSDQSGLEGGVRQLAGLGCGSSPPTRPGAVWPCPDSRRRGRSCTRRG